jgi:N utilization substance protein B
MNRIQQREQAFFLIFQNQFKANADVDSVSLYNENVEEVGEYAKELYEGVTKNTDEIDEIISSFSNGWKLNRIPKVNLSILRLAIYEIKYIESVPRSVAINEAVELAKKYSGKEDASFINGILGSYVRSLR